MAHYENIVCDSNSCIFLVCDLLVYFPNYLRMVQVRGGLPWVLVAPALVVWY